MFTFHYLFTLIYHHLNLYFAVVLCRHNHVVVVLHDSNFVLFEFFFLRFSSNTLSTINKIINIGITLQISLSHLLLGSLTPNNYDTYYRLFYMFINKKYIDMMLLF